MSLVRRASVIALTALAAAVWTQIPGLPAVDVGIGPDRAISSNVACPVATGRDATSTLDVASATTGDARVFASFGGGVVSEEALIIGDGLGASTDLSEQVGASTVGVVADLPEGGAGAAIVTESTVVLAAANCSPPVRGETAIAGVSTAAGERLDLVLSNPYSNDAVVEVRTVSEAGADSASELESVLIPARSVNTIDLSQILPLRNRLSIRILVERGVVHAAAVQSSDVERMVVEAVEPAREWIVPLPATGTSPIVTILPTAGVDIDYSIEPLGLNETVLEVIDGSIPANDQLTMDPSLIPEGATALRVSTSGLSVVGVVIESDSIRAGTPGASRTSSEWLVPGPSGDGAVLRIVNPSDLTVEAFVQPLVAGAQVQSVSVAAGGSINVPVSGPGSGFMVRADAEIHVAWSVASDAGFALAVGWPIQFAGE